MSRSQVWNQPEKYLLVKKWDDYDAEYYYEFQEFKEFEFDHSCYSCFDSWKKHRRKCEWNGPRYDTVKSGDAKWAKKMIKHYKLKKENLVII